MKPAIVSRILRTLTAEYKPDGKCFLDYSEPWQLLFATILSAQCTDARVNKVTPVLFAALPSLEAFAKADIAHVEELIRTVGFFRTKARSLQGCAIQLLHDFDGELPSGMDCLTSLPGVGRKTANVVRGHIFGIPSITVDTHVLRVSNRLGFVKTQSPVRAEFALMDILPRKSWIGYNQLVITHGRQVCRAIKPRCNACMVQKYCYHFTIGTNK